MCLLGLEAQSVLKFFINLLHSFDISRENKRSESSMFDVLDFAVVLPLLFHSLRADSTSCRMICSY